MLSGNGVACVKSCHQEVEYFREPCAKHLSSYGILFAQDMSNWLPFLGPWHPSAFQPFASEFLATIWPNSSKFSINTTTGSRSIMFVFFGPQIFLAASFTEKKEAIFGFFRVRNIFWSGFYSQLAKDNIFSLIVETLLRCAVCSDTSCQKFLRAIFCHKKWWIFLNFLKTDLPFTIANRVS